VIGKIARGDVYVIAITFPEGLTMSEMAAIADMHGVGPASAFTQAGKDPAAIRKVDPTAPDLEGYLFPETYRVSRRADPAALVHMMVDRFAHVLSPDMRRAAEARGLSIHQLVTLASLVEKETARPEERPMVAAVFLNRFRIGMALQCDPTVIYALQREGKYRGNLRRDDLAFDSPYNTYRYPGLPPGPIASPGKASLEATANPADVGYLYFVSRNDGSHEFATTLPEHNRNVQKYQVAPFRAGQAGGAGPAGRAGEAGQAAPPSRPRSR
jgi:peptidoglycan lytic transglycosylase G